MKTAMNILISGLFTASGLMVLLPTPPAFACNCVSPNPTHEEALTRSDAVFSGKVIARHDPKAGARLRSGADPIVWTFAVDRVFKGKVAKQQKVISPAFEGSCGIEFKLGTRYQVYARRSGKNLTTRLCYGTKQLLNLPAQQQPNLPTGSIPR
jgi:hypothetical protein